MNKPRKNFSPTGYKGGPSRNEYEAPKKPGLSVIVRNGDINKALRQFKKMISDDGILQEYRDRQTYVKPSAKRKKSQAAAKARWNKKQETLTTVRKY